MDAMMEAAENLPYVYRAGELINSIMLFVMYTASTNYDLYFFSPALCSFYHMSNKNKTQIDNFDKVVGFLKENFTIQEYVPDFVFSDTETADQFLLRFLQTLESQEKIPQDVRDSIIAVESYSDSFEYPPYTRGFIKPIPMYIFTRISTLFAELGYGLKQIEKDNHLDSVDTITKFLTEDFDPAIHGEGLDLNTDDLSDIMIALAFGFRAGGNKTLRLVLADGVQASTRNKQFFEHILPKVPENVKQAINVILPYL